MKAKVCAAVLTAVALLSAQTWQPAKPGYSFQFPRDHFDHPQFQTEWWYYTGNLHTKDGHRFGFELTFFRQASTAQKTLLSTATWRPGQSYLAHFALSDIDGHEFYHRERLNRAGPGLAGAGQHESRYWNGNWEVRWLQPLDGKQDLRAITAEADLELTLQPGKKPVIHGRDGISRKGPEPDEASHYISFTRLQATGTLHWKNAAYRLDGLAWMDHEFFTEPPDNTLVGWDWFAIQLYNNQEFMLYRLRRKSGLPDPFSSGTYIDEKGNAHFLDATQFSISPTDTWRSPESGEQYPVVWKISIPSLHLELTEQTALKQQELYSRDDISPSYWEGAVSYTGTMGGHPVTGVGYLEMTGYGEPMHLGGVAPESGAHQQQP